MKKEVIGKLKMHAQALLECINSMEGDGGDESEDETPAIPRKEQGDSEFAGKSLSMKLGKYK